MLVRVTLNRPGHSRAHESRKTRALGDDLEHDPPVVPRHRNKMWAKATESTESSPPSVRGRDGVGANKHCDAYAKPSKSRLLLDGRDDLPSRSLLRLGREITRPYTALSYTP